MDLWWAQLGGCPEPEGKGSFGDISRPLVKYMEYMACDCQYSQLYSVVGSGDVALLLSVLEQLITHSYSLVAATILYLLLHALQ